MSTDEVYGTLEPDDPAFAETNTYAPNSLYAAKAASDFLAWAWVHTYQLPVPVNNLSSNYGPNQFPEKLIPLMITHALVGKPLPIYFHGGVDAEAEVAICVDGDLFLRQADSGYCEFNHALSAW